MFDAFFDMWSAPMAYILGFTTADGHIKIGEPVLSYHIGQCDIDVLHFIRSNISPDKPIYHLGKYIKLDITSKKMCDSLKHLGVVPQKTGKEIMPIITDQYKFHYLRGVFDGDGSLGVYPNTNNTIKRNWHIVSASYSFLKSLQNNIGMGFGKIYPERNIYRWQIQNKVEQITICRIMYNNGFRLSRKYDKYLELERVL